MAEDKSEKRRLETDVVIVGYGGAGAVAAITAQDNGARVILLEKMPLGGGNTRVSAGVLIDPKGMGLVQYVARLCSGTTPIEIIETFVKNAIENRNWIEKMGAKTEPRSSGLDVFYPSVPFPCWPGITGGEFIDRYKVKSGETETMEGLAEKLWEVLSSAVKQRGITVLTMTRGQELITNDNGEVIGVIAEREEERISIIAKRAVVLTCGGFEYNESMKQAFLPFQPVYALGCPGNTGDGILMAQRVGAALWHMTAIASPLGFKTPEYDAAFFIRIPGGRFIYVDKDGQRFTNETALEMHDMWREVSFFDIKRFCRPSIPTYAIFDEITRRRGPLKMRGTGANTEYDWSLDNSKEIAKGWISQGKTIRDLARKISIDESALEDTIARYNQFCKKGKDVDHGRSKETLEPVEETPYYAIKLWPCLLNTQGGPRRDEKARVLNYEGKPIPRLYSAGELGSLWGFVYEAAGNLTECLSFGRIAGQNAAAEEPWC
jgi:succinate dehydrogenase/fumarate reductase flavoprotein subunit